MAPRVLAVFTNRPEQLTVPLDRDLTGIERDVLAEVMPAGKGEYLATVFNREVV